MMLWSEYAAPRRPRTRDIPLTIRTVVHTRHVKVTPRYAGRWGCVIAGWLKWEEGATTRMGHIILTNGDCFFFFFWKTEVFKFLNSTTMFDSHCHVHESFNPSLPCDPIPEIPSASSSSSDTSSEITLPIAGQCCLATSLQQWEQLEKVFHSFTLSNITFPLCSGWFHLSIPFDVQNVLKWWMNEYLTGVLFFSIWPWVMSRVFRVMACTRGTLTVCSRSTTSLSLSATLLSETLSQLLVKLELTRLQWCEFEKVISYVVVLSFGNDIHWLHFKILFQIDTRNWKVRNWTTMGSFWSSIQNSLWNEEVQTKFFLFVSHFQLLGQSAFTVYKQSAFCMIS